MGAKTLALHHQTIFFVSQCFVRKINPGDATV